MRTVTSLIVAATAAGFALCAPAAATPPTPPRAVHEYVALGDSWAADATLTGITTQFVPLLCVQSATSYAKQVAAALGVTRFRDVSCASAVTANLTSPQQLPDGRVAPPQFDQLSATTDLVTLEIGGNDAGLAAIVPTCLTGSAQGSHCAHVRGGTEDAMSASIRAAEPKVTAAIAGVRARAPHARLLLVDYMAGVSPGTGCFPQIPISADDANWLGHKLLELDAMLARVATTTGVQLVDTYTGSIGHDACRPDGIRWVEGLIPHPNPHSNIPLPFHPNQLGADHQARQILRALGR
ncbi:SGNH/GDSL hydrolase family protein [Nocardia yunnanensis]|uniref:SGNH/GDSL hydrolase family protein n=1 Tax=Nocardia yunnanensis TaxID=2382165 RepID=A0A386Z9S8_9NOCA|nr:SGNH/GDSL hydrolase family protein [Nocardia yunnanensis]AYF74562.1 SGNH/GDSL hydrolase family protein [Nocardia yunnanensis]